MRIFHRLPSYKYSSDPNRGVSLIRSFGVNFPRGSGVNSPHSSHPSVLGKSPNVVLRSSRSSLISCTCQAYLLLLTHTFSLLYSPRTWSGSYESHPASHEKFNIVHRVYKLVIRHKLKLILSLAYMKTWSRDT